MDRLIEQAIELLKQGRLVAFPTETVYGLGADASNSQAVKKIYQVKGRPSHHPVIVHIAAIEQLNNWAIDVPDEVKQALTKLWPGPLTIIAKKNPLVPSEVTGGQETIGVRVPSHPVALKLLQAFGGGVAAPSANKFGRISPTDAVHVEEELGNEVDLILPGGRSSVGIESTILDVSKKPYRILRLGAISQAQLSDAIGEPILLLEKNEIAPRAPGLLANHYAPKHTMILVEPSAMKQRVAEYKNKKLAVISFEQPLAGTWFKMPKEVDRYAHELYATLRKADYEHEIILVEAVPDSYEWAAIFDRLQRAAAK
jgi:L-threonylcarbamoyladenylate synthase